MQRLLHRASSLLLFVLVCLTSHRNVSSFSVHEVDDDLRSGLLAPGAAEVSNTRMKRSAEVPLGKRITSNLVAELGKRPREMYSFGIGKRSISDEEMAQYLAENEKKPLNKASDEADSMMALNEDELNLDGAQKRDPYSFGLGKRIDSLHGSEYGFGLGKRVPYFFGLGKRDPYSFGLGKRALTMQYKKDEPIYAFGLGKRDPYAFGLGRKRDPYAFGLGKRSPYNFGLGK